MHEGSANPYADIPPSAFPDAALADLGLALERAAEEGRPAGLARAGWVERTAAEYARRLGDGRFEALWRRLLWVAIRAELEGGTSAGFWFVRRLYLLALEARAEGEMDKPVAWALRLIRSEGLRELERDHGRTTTGGATLGEAQLGPRRTKRRANNKS